MTGRIIFDIRKLQNFSISSRPIDRILSAVIQSIPASVLSARRVQLYADPFLPLPPGLTGLGLDIVRRAPFCHEATLVIDVSDDMPSLRDMARPSVQNMVRVLTLVDRGPVTESDGDGEAYAQQLVELRMGPASNRPAGGASPNVIVPVPVVIDETLCAPCNALDEAALDVLFSGKEPVLVVDGALGADKDIMRAILGLTRRNHARILVCGEGVAVDAPEVSVLQPSPALLGQIASWALAVLVPAKGEAQMLSMPEVLQLGGRCVAVGDSLQIHHLDELTLLPAGSAAPLPVPNYAPFWEHVLEAMPVAPEAFEQKRPRIALVTPMFPQKGGPPHSSLDLALALTEIAQLDIWTDADMLPAHRARMNAVYRLDADFEPDRYDGIVYVLGNHPMYLKIFNMMCEYGGTLILHDAQMLDFLNYRYGSKQLSDFLSQEYGSSIDASDPGKIIGKLSEYGRPFLREILRHAGATIVHSPIAATVIRNLYEVDVNYFPVAMPYPFKPSELTPQARLQAKLALGISSSRPCIASFGEVHMLKGAKQCLFVMKELLDWGIDFQFLFVGPVEEPLANELRERIKQYGLEDYVAIKGAVSEADYIQHLKAVDMVLQIRQIPFGQVWANRILHGEAEQAVRDLASPPPLSAISGLHQHALALK